jgi:ABC-type oligopeptide transport system substrate-binding subunit
MEDKHQQNPQAEEIIINRDTIIIPLVWNSRIRLIKPNVNAEILPFYQQLEDWLITK